MQRTQFQSLVWELRSHMPHGVAKKHFFFPKNIFKKELWKAEVQEGGKNFEGVIHVVGLLFPNQNLGLLPTSPIPLNIQFTWEYLLEECHI